jgi:DNA-nicking Smr family endonuclease
MDDEPPVEIPIEDALDLHSFAPRDVLAVVDDYLRAAREAGFAEVRLIHGRGKGVQRAAVQRLLGDRSRSSASAMPGCARPAGTCYPDAWPRRLRARG